MFFTEGDRMAAGTYKLVWIVFRAILVAGMAGAAFGQNLDIPKPVIRYNGWQDNTENGRTLRQYKFEVVNRDSFPDEIFAAAPELEPCGRNANASRTWINIYDGRGRRIYGFCALRSNAELSLISFNLPPDEVPPEKVYIDMVDRQTRTVYASKKVKLVQ